MDGHDTALAEDQSADSARVSRKDAQPISGEALNALSQELVARLARKLDQRLDVGSIGPEDVDPGKIDAFCHALIAQDARPANQFFARLRAEGGTTDTLCLGYIAGAARRLGEWWVADTCGFLEVTLGSSRLHGLQRGMCNDFTSTVAYQPPEMTALFSAVPGETHVLGVAMAADFFRRAGWNVDLNLSPDLDVLTERAGAGEYTLIGISASCEATLAPLHATFERLRAVQPRAKMVLGGGITGLQPEIGVQIGADVVSTDIATAPFSCQSMVLPVI